MDFDLSEQEMKQAVDYAKNSNTILLGVRCKRGCIFCSEINCGPEIGPPPAFKNLMSLDQFRQLMKLLDLNKTINFVNGDIFDNPLVYDYLEILYEEQLRQGSTTTIDMSSSCGSFNEERIDDYKRIKTIRCHMSIHTFDTEFKNTVLRNGWTDDQTRVLKRLIRERAINIASVWSFGDLDRFRRDMEMMSSLVKGTEGGKPFALGIAYPSSTKYSMDKAKELSRKALQNWDEAVKIYLGFLNENKHILPAHFIMRDLSKHLKDGKDIPSYPYSLMKDFNKRIDKAKKYFKENKLDISKAAFITTQTCYDYAKAKYPYLNWILAHNNYFGGDIVCCGLLIYSDVLETIKSNDKYETYVLTKNMRNTNGDKDLKCMDISELKDKVDGNILFF